MIPKPRYKNRNLLKFAYPTREVDKDYLEYIKRQPCLIHDGRCVGDIVPHHTKTKGASGSDYKTVPLCATHHNEVHVWGRYTFQESYNISFSEEIIRLLAGYIRQK